VETDVSNRVLGEVLSQKFGNGLWYPIAFFSSSMNGAEKNYEIHNKELLAVVKALKEWHTKLEGLQRNERFQVLTDHQALQYFMTSKKLNAWQAR
jgi:CRISPR/Cas system CMR-associated protein Cmr5 small subunit